MLFETGPIRVMTYLTSRADDDTMMVEGNETMTERRDDVFEEFTVDLMGAWSGISAAGLALASAIALMNFWEWTLLQNLVKQLFQLIYLTAENKFPIRMQILSVGFNYTMKSYEI